MSRQQWWRLFGITGAIFICSMVLVLFVLPTSALTITIPTCATVLTGIFLYDSYSKAAAREKDVE